MTRGALVGGLVACALSAGLCSWAYRLEVDQSALPYDFAFEKPKNGAATAGPAGFSGELADAIQFQLRPVFSPSRKPVQIGDPEPASAPEEVDADPPAPVATSTSLKLLGTEKDVRGDTALIIDEDTGVSTWVAAGEIIGGWRVLEVRTDSILLASDEGASNLELTLYPEQADP